MEHDCIANSIIESTFRIGVNTFKRVRVCKICSTIWSTTETRKGMSTTSSEDKINRILDNVCQVFDITREQLIGRERPKRLAIVRHIAMHLCHEAGYSYAAIGRVFGRNHAGVMYGCRNVRNRMKEDPHLQRMISLAKYHHEAEDYAIADRTT
jgi:chromosomal replication initiation ATPase DnaA